MSCSQKKHYRLLNTIARTNMALCCCPAELFSRQHSDTSSTPIRCKASACSHHPSHAPGNWPRATSCQREWGSSYRSFLFMASRPLARDSNEQANQPSRQKQNGVFADPEARSTESAPLGPNRTLWVPVSRIKLIPSKMQGLPKKMPA